MIKSPPPKIPLLFIMFFFFICFIGTCILHIDNIIFLSFPTDDEPVCLASIPSHDWTNNLKVLPIPAIQRHLAAA